MQPGAGIFSARLAAQLLVERRPRGAADVVGHLLAVQAQDARGARLAIRARTSMPSAADVDRALTVDRTLVVGWLNRGTLHLVRAEDYWWLHALTTPQLVTGTMRRLRQEGLDLDDAERGVAVLTRALGRDGPLARGALREELLAADVPAAGQGLVHLLVLATLRGLVVRGPLLGREQAFVLATDWLSRPGPVDRDVALARLARRYLAAHGPATDADLARWAGIPVREARAGLAGLAGDVVDSAAGTVALRATGDADTPGIPPPRLLGAFDPLLLGWRSRAGVLGEHEADVVSGGVFRAVALVDGRAVGLWRLGRGTVLLSLFRPMPDDVVSALAEDGHDVVRFLGGTPRRREPSPRATNGARLGQKGRSPMGPSGPGRP